MDFRQIRDDAKKTIEVQEEVGFGSLFVIGGTALIAVGYESKNSDLMIGGSTLLAAGLGLVAYKRLASDEASDIEVFDDNKFEES